jgi:hypothetical protein
LTHQDWISKQAMVLHRIHLLFRPTFRAEPGARIDFPTAVRAELFGCQGPAALGTELPAAHLRTAVWTGGDDGLLEPVGGDIIDWEAFSRALLMAASTCRRSIPPAGQEHNPCTASARHSSIRHRPSGRSACILWKCGLALSTAEAKALSWAFSQAAERTFRAGRINL